MAGTSTARKQVYVRVEGEVYDQLAALAVAGGAFDWAREEPDIYDATLGEQLCWPTAFGIAMHL